MSKTSTRQMPARASKTSPTGSPPTKKRKGVGSSVADLKFGPVDNFVLLCAKVHVEQLRPRGTKIFSIQRSETVPKLFKLLTENNILSVPVVTNKGTYYGFVDMMNIVSFVSGILPSATELEMNELEVLFAKDSRLSMARVKDIMDFPVKKVSPFHPHHVGSSLFTAWELLAKEKVHRIPVISQTEEIQDVITQSMLIDFLWQNIETISNASQMKISEMDKPTMILQTIKKDEKAIIAFRRMIHREINGLGVVDDEGKLVDNISIRDLKGLTWNADTFSHLWNPIADYKERIKTEFPDHFIPTKVIALMDTDTLYTVIEKMALEHVHRIWVVENQENMKPTRVITQTDVLKQLLKLEAIFPVST